MGKYTREPAETPRGYVFPSISAIILESEAIVSEARAENSFLIAAVAANSSRSARFSREGGPRQWAISNAYTAIVRSHLSPHLPCANETIPNAGIFFSRNRVALLLYCHREIHAASTLHIIVASVRRYFLPAFFSDIIFLTRAQMIDIALEKMR